MSDSRTARTAAGAAAAARALLLDPTKLSGPFQPTTPLGYRELVHLGEFVGWHAGDDFRLRAEEILTASATSDRPLDDELVKTIRRAMDDPCARTLRRVELFLDSDAVRFNLGPEVQARTDKLVAVLPFHRSAYGCPQASSTCAALAVDAAMENFSLGLPGAGIRALKASIIFAQDAHVDARQDDYVPTPRYPRLQALEELATEWLPGVVACATAERMLRDEDDVMRGGVGVAADTAVAVGVDLSELGDVAAAARSIEAEATAPTLVVLAPRGVDHLPGSADSGKGTRSSYTSANPRIEWEPLAGHAFPLVHGVDAAAAARDLEAEFPYASAELRLVLGDTVGARFTRPRPTLFLGSPGCGKTRAARRLTEVLGLPLTLYSCAGVSDAAFGSTSRQWSTGRACVPLQAIKRTGVANPMIVLDELNRAGTRAENGRLTDTLISMLEPEGARRYHDSFIETAVDLSAVCYLATANSLDGIPDALLDRFRIVRFPEPRAQDLPVLASAMVRAYRDERGLDPTWCPDLAPDEVDLLSHGWKGGSLRKLARLTDALLSGREALATRN